MTSFLTLHRDKEHRYKKGIWTWDEDEIKFHSFQIDQFKQKQSVDFRIQIGEQMNVAEEKVYRDSFQAPVSPENTEVLTLQDIKNLVFFLIKTKVSQKFIECVCEEIFDKFLFSVIFYTDYFLKVLELLLIRRDSTLVDGKTRDKFSYKVEQYLSKQLSNRRLLISREYSKVCNLLIYPYCTLSVDFLDFAPV